MAIAWQAGQAAAMHDAIRMSDTMATNNLPLAITLHGNASWLSERVRSGTVQMSDVAGAEIYKEKAK